MDEKILSFLTEEVLQFIIHTATVDQKLIDNLEVLDQQDYFELKTRLNHAEKIWDIYLTRIKQDVAENVLDADYIHKDIAEHYFYSIGLANTLISEFETNKQ